MSTQNTIVIPFKAAADFSSYQYRLVKRGTGDNDVALAEAATAPILGAINQAPASGMPVGIQMGPVIKVVASAAISKGDKLTGTTGGKAVATTTAGQHFIGFALDAASADGDVIRCRVAPGVVASATASFTGSHTVTAGEDTANTVDIDTGLVSVSFAMVKIRRSGKYVSSDPAVSWSGANVTVANGSTYVLTENDVVDVLAFE